MRKINVNRIKDVVSELSREANFNLRKDIYHALQKALKKETAESLLRKLMEDDDPSQNNVRYILAVMLERKKILAEKDVTTSEAGEITRFYEHRKTGEMFVIPDPRLQLDGLEQTQIQVLQMLGGKVPGGEAAEDGRQITDDGEQDEDSAP